eukprot:6431996-Pyramimonas_sp.AAC.1
MMLRFGARKAVWTMYSTWTLASAAFSTTVTPQAGTIMSLVCEFTELPFKKNSMLPWNMVQSGMWLDLPLTNVTGAANRKSQSALCKHAVLGCFWPDTSSIIEAAGERSWQSSCRDMLCSFHTCMVSCDSRSFRAGAVIFAASGWPAERASTGMAPP